MADDAVRIGNTAARLRKAEQDLRRIDRCMEDGLTGEAHLDLDPVSGKQDLRLGWALGDNE